MSDIRARLADALREAANQWCPEDDIDDEHPFYGALADRLLLLPGGIAVVDLEADIDRLADALRRADTEVFANNPTDEYEKRTRNMVKAVLSAAAQAQEHQ